MYPKIGIRPVIDGRQFGVREDLEQQTMHMANAAKDLIESNLRYPDGTKVECASLPPLQLAAAQKHTNAKHSFRHRMSALPCL